MKAIRIISPKNMEISELPMPEIKKDDEVLIRVKTGGLCGSDIHIYHGHNKSATYPRIIGHEFAGEVVSIGKEVKDLAAGDHVVGDPVISCDNCYPCTVSRHNVCINLKALGVHTDGAFREYIVLPQENVHKIPNDISWEDAALIEPFTISAQVVWRGGVTEKDTVFIMGAGPIGLCILQAVKRIGARCFISDLIDQRLEMAKNFGADMVINADKQDVNQAVLDATGGAGVPVVIDSVCIPQSFENAVKLATPAGRIVLLGFSSTPSQIAQFDIVSKELDVRGTRLNNYKFPEVVEWFRKKEVDPKSLITHVFHFTDIKKAMEQAEKRPHETCKIILKFD